MEREESILELVGGVIVCFFPLWLFFTYSGREVISLLINLLSKHYTILTRAGIDKIQANMNIHIEYEVISCEPSFAVVKAKANLQEENTIETFGKEQ